MFAKFRILLGAVVLSAALPATVVWAQPAEEKKGAETEAGAGTAAAVKSTIDQHALDLLKAMSQTLSAAKTRSFSVQSMIPFKKQDGPWVLLLGSSRVVTQGADKLFVETRGDLFPFDFFYDGKTITYFAPKQNFYAQKEAPGTIDEMIENGYQNGEGSFVYAEILMVDPYPVLTKDLLSAIYVGKSTVGTTKTDHLALSNDGVDWQIWIDEKTRLPRLVSATYVDHPGEPDYTVEFKDWKLDEPVSDETFAFRNTSKAAKIDYQSPFASASQTSQTA